jgi:hypothetical protein
MRVKTKEILDEYRFHFHLGGCATSSDRYFLAHDAEEAMRMFDYACSKRHIVPDVDRVEKWNRWSEKWEDITFLTKDTCLN